jgi:hypothetical protein
MNGRKYSGPIRAHPVIDHYICIGFNNAQMENQTEGALDVIDSFLNDDRREEGTLVQKQSSTRTSLPTVQGEMGVSHAQV